MVKIMLSENKDMEIYKKDGDNKIIREVRIRNIEIVKIMIEKKEKV
jgi:hypothetical protein